MQKVLWGLSVLLIVVAAGCGGGGGTVSQALPDASKSLSDDIVGTWQVQSLGLPNNQVQIEKDGDVAVEADGSQTRSDSSNSLVVIGSCSSSGTLSLNGSWVVDGVEHSIVATGNVNSSALSLSATVRQNEEIVCQNVTVTGVKDSEESSDVETPPAPPAMDDSQYDTPPAPPF